MSHDPIGHLFECGEFLLSRDLVLEHREVLIGHLLLIHGPLKENLEENFEGDDVFVPEHMEVLINDKEGLELPGHLKHVVHLLNKVA